MGLTVTAGFGGRGVCGVCVCGGVCAGGGAGGEALAVTATVVLARLDQEWFQNTYACGVSNVQERSTIHMQHGDFGNRLCACVCVCFGEA